MIRFPIAATLLLVSCATPAPASAGASQAQTLLELLGGEVVSRGCPANNLLHLEGAIDAESAEALIEGIAACSGRRIVLEINSPGGSVFAAIRIQKAIEAHNKGVFCVVDGMVASAAFVTLQACSSRYATSRSLLMAHSAAMGVKGQVHQLRNGLAALEAIDWGIIEYCSQRMGMTHAAFADRIRDGREWYLSQADALQFHAIDGPAASVAEIVKMVVTP